MSSDSEDQEKDKTKEDPPQETAGATEGTPINLLEFKSKLNVDFSAKEEPPIPPKKVIRVPRSQFDLAVQTQLNRKALIESSVSELTAEELEQLSIEEIDYHKSILETMWSDFNNVHSQLIETSSDEERQHEYFILDCHNICMIVFHRAVRELGKLKAKLVAATRQSSSSSSRTSSEQLSRLNIPPFSGKYEDWPAFRDLFLALVGSKEHISSVEKIVRLKECLKGEAAVFFANVELTEKNYDQAFQKLSDRYENRRLIIRSHLKRLLALKPLKEKSAKGLLHIMNTITEVVDSLKLLKVPVEHWDILITHIAWEVIDMQTREAWEQKVGNTTDPPSLQEFMVFLQAHARRRIIRHGSQAINRKEHRSSQ